MTINGEALRGLLATWVSVRIDLGHQWNYPLVINFMGQKAKGIPTHFLEVPPAELFDFFIVSLHSPLH